jgi:4-amino-4-deoxy-L-arabinose transferase-like glycosyltransferase
MRFCRDRLDPLLAVSVGAAYFAVLCGTAWAVGFTRDEGYYFDAARLYLGWLERLWRGVSYGDLAAARDDVIVRSWSYNAEHPPLMKMLFGLSWKLFHDTLGWCSHATAYRLPSMVLAGGMVSLATLLAAQTYGRRVGLFAALALATIPRLFHDAHLACFDVPVAALQLAVVYAFWRALTSVRWCLATGVLFGLALATKHNAFLIPVILAVHALLRAKSATDPARPPVPLAFLAMSALGPVTLYALWPYLWHHPLARLGAYLRFHLHHEHYPVEYFGQVLTQPPFPTAFVFVMTAVTVPLSILLLMTMGVLRGVALEAARLTGRPLPCDREAEDPRATRLLLLLAGVLPLLPFTLPGVPIFGGVKHWFAAMPALAILAAVEFDRLTRTALERWSVPRGAARALYAALALLTLLPAVLGIRLVHPYGIAFYNELIGGVRGAADAGMLRSFWGYASRGNLAYLNAHVEQGGAVYFHRTTRQCYEAYRRDGLLRPDIRYSPTLEGASWATIDVQRPFADDEYRVWNEWGTARPVVAVEIDEVPINVVYRRALTRPHVEDEVRPRITSRGDLDAQAVPSGGGNGDREGLPARLAAGVAAHQHDVVEEHGERHR